MTMARKRVTTLSVPLRIDLRGIRVARATALARPLGDPKPDQVVRDQRQLGILSDDVVRRIEQLDLRQDDQLHRAVAGAQEPMYPTTFAPVSNSNVVRWLTISRSLL